MKYARLLPFFAFFFYGIACCHLSSVGVGGFLNNPLICVLIRVVPEVEIPRHWGEIPDGYLFLFPFL